MSSIHNNANVACRQLGFGYGEYLGTTGTADSGFRAFPSYIDDYASISADVSTSKVEKGGIALQLGLSEGWYDVSNSGRCDNYCRWVHCDSVNWCSLFLCTIGDEKKTLSANETDQ